MRPCCKLTRPLEDCDASLCEDGSCAQNTFCPRDPSPAPASGVVTNGGLGPPSSAFTAEVVRTACRSRPKERGEAQAANRVQRESLQLRWDVRGVLGPELKTGRPRTVSETLDCFCTFQLICRCAFCLVQRFYRKGLPPYLC